MSFKSWGVRPAIDTNLYFVEGEPLRNEWCSALSTSFPTSTSLSSLTSSVTNPCPSGDPIVPATSARFLPLTPVSAYLRPTPPPLLNGLRLILRSSGPARTDAEPERLDGAADPSRVIKPLYARASSSPGVPSSISPSRLLPPFFPIASPPTSALRSPLPIAAVFSSCFFSTSLKSATYK